MAIARVIGCLVAWFAVFTIGVKVDSSSLGGGFGEMVLYTLSATSTNVGVLAVVASLVSNKTGWLESVARGFTIYVMLISGAVVLFTESMTAPTLPQYSKIAGTVSLFCVLCSYKPELFEGFLERVSAVFVGEKKDGGSVAS